MTGRLGARLYALIAILILTVTAAPAVAQWSPPAVIDPAAFGAPTFRDDFDTLDAGPDYDAKTARHRWRTVSKGCLKNEIACQSGNMAGDLTNRRAMAGNQGVYLDPTTPLSPFKIAEGKLTIAITGLSPLRVAQYGRPFSSGYLSTKFSFAQATGYFEARLALPAGKGMLPAFWLMPLKGAWPAGGEIDVMENVGNDRVYFASYHAKPGGKVVHSTVEIKSVTTLSRVYHRYGVAVTAKEIVWYFDGKEVRRVTKPIDIVGPFYLILNVAVGHSWPGPMKVKSGRMAIDYVSVWRVPNTPSP